MKTIQKGSKGLDVLSLQCSIPGVTIDGVFGPGTEAEVKKFQSSRGLKDDGVVGDKTWKVIIDSLGRHELGASDFKGISESLGVSPAILRAIYTVESSGQSYLKEGYPSLLFEAHVFWRELKKEGKNPEVLQKSHPGILSPTWNKKLYRGGIKEVPRIDEAFLISPKAALRSASFGAFQICGFTTAGNVFDFYRKMWKNQEGQLDILANFLKASGIIPYMKSLNFREIARRYNGAGYEKNQYHIKLEKAYLKFK